MIAPTSPRQRRLAEFLDRVWSAGEIAACDRFVAAAYTILNDPGDPWEGQTLDPDGFRDRVRQSRAPFPDQRFDVQDWFENAHSVAVTWLWSATHQGDFPGFPATGRRLTMSGATSYRFDAEDRLTGHWQIADRLGVFRQLQAAASPGGSSN
ncbi:MAG: ester cyclase [Rhodobacteraceae bacterium]|nr:ester cyclase [Paracoccaceae bacterium]